MAKRGRPAKIPGSNPPEFGGLSEPMKDEESAETPEFEKHEVEAAANDIARAETHKKNSKLMKAVGSHVDTKITSFKQLRKLAHKSSAGVV